MSEGYPFWAWMFGGLALSALETLSPGSFLIWIGAAGLLVGAVDYFLPMAFEVQALLFAAFAAILAFVGKRVYGSVLGSGAAAQVSRAEAMVGKEFFLDTPIEHGFGSVRVGDTVWRVAGPETPAGAKVRIVAAESGADLRVEKV